MMSPIGKPAQIVKVRLEKPYIVLVKPVMLPVMYAAIFGKTDTATAQNMRPMTNPTGIPVRFVKPKRTSASTLTTRIVIEPAMYAITNEMQTICSHLTFPMETTVTSFNA